jgi:hypothetical protein
MKISRLIASGAAVALIGASALALGGVANAADAENYVTAGQFVNETSPYPAGWFRGTIANPGTITTASGGLTVVGPVQILNGTPGAVPAGGLAELATGAKLNVPSGNAAFQISLYSGAGQTDFTTLRPDNYNQAGLNPLAGWTTSGAFGTFTAGSSHTLPEYDAEALVAGNPVTLLAYGAFVPAGQTAVISTISFNSDINHFTAAPTGVATPASISVTAFSTTGVVVTLTGFVPGESVDEFFITPTSQSSGETGVVHTADANGTATFSFVGPAQSAPGTYRVGAYGADNGAVADFAVVANGTTTAPPATPISGNATFTG